MRNLFGQILVGVSLLMISGADSVLASETEHAKPKKEAEAPPATPGIALPIGEDMDPVRAYCTNIRDKAADARAAAQTKQLTELEKKIEEKIKALEVREAEVKSWVDKQQKIRRRRRHRSSRSMPAWTPRWRPSSWPTSIPSWHRLSSDSSSRGWQAPS